MCVYNQGENEGGAARYNKIQRGTTPRNNTCNTLPRMISIKYNLNNELQR